ncbi:hypothetical protein [Rhodoblastus sp.]|uniref:hypothetical protein n=1 Tax=Rhodoblastus sp. TaxID=1962975 RepID=UPI0035AD857C
MIEDPTPSPPSAASVELAGVGVERLHAEIDALRQRLDAAERALAEERRAFAVWRSRSAETAPIELSPQAINDLAEAISKFRRQGSPFRRIMRFLRPEK